MMRMCATREIVSARSRSHACLGLAKSELRPSGWKRQASFFIYIDPISKISAKASRRSA